MLFKLYNWYYQNKRVLPWRETTDPYLIWVSEIILQQTRVAQGLEYYLRFVNRFPTVTDLALASEDEVLHLWQGLGYYSRARNMHKAARIIMERWQGQFPYSFSDILSLPGIGNYTAGAITSFAYNLPYPALDGNVYRVLARLNDSEVVFDTSGGKNYFHTLAQQLLDRDNPRLFNSAIMEFGALYCVPQSPQCEQCPIGEYCLAYAHHTVNLLPLRKPRTSLRERYLNYYIYLQFPNPQSSAISIDGGQIGSTYTLIHQRQKNDIWKHLWEFPLLEKDRLLDESPHFDFTHILSHQRIHARFVVRRVNHLPNIADTRRITLSQIDDFAFSRLTLKALDKVKHALSL